MDVNTTDSERSGRIHPPMVHTHLPATSLNCPPRDCRPTNSCARSRAASFDCRMARYLASMAPAWWKGGGRGGTGGGQGVT